MADPELVALIGEGPDAWNLWREKSPGIKVCLREVDLSRMYLSGADLSEVDLCQAKLNGADLSGAVLNRADLRRADLSHADLRGSCLNKADLGEAILMRANLRRVDLGGADLSGADLRSADLRGADLFWANLNGADLSETVLNRANIGNTVWANLDLSHTKGLENCSHRAPSAIDHQTLAKSGHLPLAFLRGCGLPDTLITYLPSIFLTGIEFHSCFISYSTRNRDFADRLHADLQNNGVRCWFAPHDMQSGKKIHEQIDAAIQVHDRLLLILSEDSIKSGWVETEIAKARKREIKENRRMLFPVRLIGLDALMKWECFDSDSGRDSAREIREYFVPDFSNWKNHDDYQKGFERLLEDLKTNQGAAQPPSVSMAHTSDRRSSQTPSSR